MLFIGLICGAIVGALAGILASVAFGPIIKPAPPADLSALRYEVGRLKDRADMVLERMKEIQPSPQGSDDR